MENIVSQILELGLSQGIWAALYLYLFFRMLNENKAREDKYQQTISQLSTNIEQGIYRIQNKLEVIAERNEEKRTEE